MKLTHKINKSEEFIFDYLTDMQKFVSVHPVISKIEKKDEENYLVYETLKMGFLPFSFTYPVTVESDFAEKFVTIKATVMKLTKIEMTFKINSVNKTAIVEEEIHFKSLFPVKSLVEKIFRKQHKQLFRNIELLK